MRAERRATMRMHRVTRRSGRPVREGIGCWAGRHPDISRITSLHTLGPAGTNCELAARRWGDRTGLAVPIILHGTLEEAADHVAASAGTALVACCAYPELHTLVYERIGRLTMVDCFLMATHHMVLARRTETACAVSICVHPAPAALAPASYATVLGASSNSDAARRCASGLADACVTTLTAAVTEGLDIVQDFGPVTLSFSVHVAARS